MEKKDSGNTFQNIWVVLGCIVLVIAIITVAVFLVGKHNKSSESVLRDKNSDVILTVDDDQYSKEDMLYYIYTEEETGVLYDEIYMQFYGASYWDMEDEENDNLTGEEVAKRNIMKNLKQDAVFYREAVKAGYQLSESDKKEAKKNYDEFVSELTEEQMRVPGMKDALLVYFEHQVLIDEYKDTLLDESGFDYDAVEATVSKEDCREYDYEYYSIDKEDEDGNPYSKRKRKKMLASLKKLKKQTNASTNMEKQLKKSGIQDVDYYEDYLVVQDLQDDGGYGKYKGVDVDAQLMALKNGEVSDVLETDWAYFVFRMKDNNSTQYYDETVDEAISDAQKEIYDATFKKISDQYKIEVNEERWEKLEVGTIIYNLGSEDTTEDSEK